MKNKPEITYGEGKTDLLYRPDKKTGKKMYQTMNKPKPTQQESVKEGPDYVFGDDMASVSLSRIVRETNNLKLKRTVGRFMAKTGRLLKELEVPNFYKKEMYKILRDKSINYIQKNKEIQKYPDIASHMRTVMTTRLRRKFLK